MDAEFAVHMDENGNAAYGFSEGLALIGICGSFKYNGVVYLLALWEGDDMPEAVPALVLGDIYPMRVIDYFESITFFPEI